jgi:hypothetical protein
VLPGRQTSEAGGDAAEPPAPAPEPVRTYYLTNGAGEYLQKSGTGMTRNKGLAWRGTASQMEAAFKANRALKELEPERAPA